MRSSLALVGVLAASAPSGAWAADIMVGSTADDGQRCTLRDAIRTAQNGPGYGGIGGCGAGSAGVDRIVVPAGTYRLTAGGAGDDQGTGGDLDIRESVIVEGADRARVIIDGNGRDRVFHVMGRGVRAEIRGVTVQNGNAGGEDGGGIYVLEGATLVLEDAIVARNVSNVGGGGVDSFGDLVVNRTIIENNRTQNDGGLRCLATCTGRLTDVIVRNNTATGNVGGGLGAAGNLILTRVQVLDNVHTGALGAGGLSALQFMGGTNTIVVVDSLISGNTTGGDGGGVRVGNIAGYFDGAPQVTIVNTTIVNNRAARGAGVSVTIGRATLSSVTIADNQATSEGGGVLRSGNGTLGLRNTLIARNRATRGPDCRGSADGLGYTMVANGADCQLSAAQGNQVGRAAPIDARLDMGLADNGGPMRTLGLLAGGPAIDAADPAGCGDGMRALDFDQRGTGFPRVVGGRCDIGAFELGASACGNGTVDPGERCDNASTCCSGACQPVTVGTGCDDGNANTDMDACNAQGHCVGISPTCGNNMTDTAAGETCDDGNMDETDLCSSTCQETFCGDGVVQQVRGEACDDGPLNSDFVPGACRSSCQPPSCADGVEDPGEMCGSDVDSGVAPLPAEDAGPGADAADAGPRPTTSPNPRVDDAGCGCASSGEGAWSALAVLALALVVRARRRR